MSNKTANEWDEEVKRLWGPLTAVDYAPGVPFFDTRFRVYREGTIIGSGNSYAEAVERAKMQYPPKEA